MMCGWFSERFGHSNQCTKCTGLFNWPRHLLKNAGSQHVPRVSSVFKTSFLKMSIQVKEFGEESDIDIDNFWKPGKKGRPKSTLLQIETNSKKKNIEDQTSQFGGNEMNQLILSRWNFSLVGPDHDPSTLYTCCIPFPSGLRRTGIEPNLHRGRIDMIFTGVPHGWDNLCHLSCCFRPCGIFFYLQLVLGILLPQGGICVTTREQLSLENNPWSCSQVASWSRIQITLEALFDHPMYMCIYTVIIIYMLREVFKHAIDIMEFPSCYIFCSRH